MKEVNQNQPISITKQGKYMFKGGYWDGKFLLFNFHNEEKQFYITDDYSRVTCIDNDPDEHFLFVGTITGRMFIYNLDLEVEGKLELELERILTDHDSEITNLTTSNKLNVLATVSVDKTCNLYTYPTFELFRVIKNEGFYFDYVKTNFNFRCFCLYNLLRVLLCTRDKLSHFIHTISMDRSSSQKRMDVNTFSLQ
jgi:WD40 repeat protein